MQKPETNIISRIILHEKPHADELAALVILRWWGKLKFPGVEKAKISLFGGGRMLEAKNLPKDTIAIGVGGGMFDEHGRENNQEQCTATLVAKALDLFYFRPLTKILAQTLREDRNGNTRKNEIPSIVKILHMVGTPFEQVLAWYEDVFWAEYRHEENLADSPEYFGQTNRKWLQRFQNLEETTLETGYELVKEDLGKESADRWIAFAHKAMAKRQEMFLEAKAEWKKNGKSFCWNTMFGTIRIGYHQATSTTINGKVVSGDSSLLSAAARNDGVSLFVQQNSLGNVQIFTDKRREIDLTEVARQIRLTEAKKRKMPIMSMRTLDMEGTHPEMPIWHLLEGNHSMLLNGSLTADGVEPTLLTLEEIVEIVKWTIGDRAATPQSRGFQKLERAMDTAKK